MSAISGLFGGSGATSGLSDTNLTANASQQATQGLNFLNQGNAFLASPSSLPQAPTPSSPLTPQQQASIGTQYGQLQSSQDASILQNAANTGQGPNSGMTQQQINNNNTNIASQEQQAISAQENVNTTNQMTAENTLLNEINTMYTDYMTDAGLSNTAYSTLLGADMQQQQESSQALGSLAGGIGGLFGSTGAFGPSGAFSGVGSAISDLF